MVRVGVSAPWEHVSFPEGLRRRRAAGFDLTVLSDHISFRDGSGQDALMRAAMIHALQPDVSVLVSSYLLALRHPSIVARQIAELNAIAPGKLVLGVGVGGDDRHEIESCGVDPRTRGRRTDEALACLIALQSGKPVTFKGDHFDLKEVKIVPPVVPVTPILIAGRSSKALERAARYGEGWFGIFVSADRFANATDEIEQRAAELARSEVPWQHGMQLWCSVDNNRAKARQRLAERLESFYQVPFEKFERYCPVGSAEEVAEFVSGYVEQGASLVNLTTPGSDEEVIDQAAAVREILAREN